MAAYICFLSILSYKLLKSVKSRWMEILSSFPKFVTIQKSDLLSTFLGETPPGNVQLCFLHVYNILENTLYVTFNRVMHVPTGYLSYAVDI